MKMRMVLVVMVSLLVSLGYAQNETALCSWNLKDFGQSKKPEEITAIATVLRSFDLVAIQEVVAGFGGAQAVAALADELNRMGTKWDYSISEPTSSSAYKQERYAFLWKSGKLTKKGDAWLERQYEQEIDREPYLATFLADGKEFTVVNFHAITKSRQPETEIKYFKLLPAEYPSLNLIFAGDFNCPQSHTVFNPLKKMGYQPALINQKTSLRHQCIEGDCLASEFDNIFYHAPVQPVSSGVVHFYTQYSNLEEANHLSDHVPVYLTFSLN